MKNNCNYSDQWQPYIGDYDKFEYDIKLKDGTIVENCYPNAGQFGSISDLHNDQSFLESEVLEIRFSQSPRYYLNGDVSTAIPDQEYQERLLKKRKEEKLRMRKHSFFNIYAAGAIYTDYYSSIRDYEMPRIKQPKGRRIEVRTDPKIGRNDICPKCESGLKYKRCCGKA